MDKRLNVKVLLVVTDDVGNVTVKNDLLLGVMKLEDTIKVEQVLINAFSGILAGQSTN